MNIVKDGHPFIFAFAIITFAVGYWGSLIWAVVMAIEDFYDEEYLNEDAIFYLFFP